MSESSLPAQIELIAELEGHDDRAWHIAWNPTKPIIATCSADKTVRMYTYRALDSSNPTKLEFSNYTTIPTGHTKTVRSIAWSPSGKTLATGSFDSNIGIWAQELDDDDEEGGVQQGEWECMSLLEGHETECKSVGFSSSGTLLATCSRDKTVWIWEVKPDSDFECMGVLMEHSQDVKCVAWHPKEEILASASYDDTINLYLDDPSDDWFCASTLKGHDSTVWTLAWEPTDGRYLASGSDDNTIRIWRITGGPMSQIDAECVDVIQGHHNSVFAISWSPGNGDSGRGQGGSRSLGWLASTGGDCSVMIWEILENEADKKISHTLLARVDGAHEVFDVNSLVWCPRSGLQNVFATAGDDGHLKVWKLNFS